MRVEGNIEKMRARLGDGPDAPVVYELPLFNGDQEQCLPMNARIGEPLTLRFEGEIACTHCGRATKKSFAQGFCFPCFKRLAACDMCIMKPEQCHFDAGTCREPDWGQANCMIDHFVYLANSSGVKVGITRHSQVPTRWIDQGASQALPVFQVATRQISGLLEDAIRAFENDKTDWRRMLKGEPEAVDLLARREALYHKTQAVVADLRQRFGEQAVRLLPQASVTQIVYPVREYPQKIKTFNLDKEPLAQGRLMGIKGQYLIFDSAVINLRKYTGYRLSLEF